MVCKSCGEARIFERALVRSVLLQNLFGTTEHFKRARNIPSIHSFVSGSDFFLTISDYNILFYVSIIIL